MKNDKLIVQLAFPDRKFVKVYHDFLYCDLLSIEEKMVFIALKSFIDFSSDKGGAKSEVFPTVETICRITSISKPRAIRIINGLVQKGVVKKIQRGLTKPNIYIISDYASMWECGDIDELKRVTMHEGVKSLSAEEHIEELQRLGYEVIIKAKEPDSVPATVTESSPQSSTSDDILKNQNCQEDKTYKIKYDIEKVKEQFEFDVIVNDLPEHRELIETIFNILQELLNTSKKAIRVDGEDKPREVVLSRLKKLNTALIRHVVEVFVEQGVIKNPRAYIITLLYNAEIEYSLKIENIFNQYN